MPGAGPFADILQRSHGRCEGMWITSDETPDSMLSQGYLLMQTARVDLL